MNNSILLMVAVLAAIAMLSAAVVLPMQQASAQNTRFSFDQRQSNECSGTARCTNMGTLTFRLPTAGG